MKEANDNKSSSTRVLKLGLSELYKIADKQRSLGPAGADVTVKLMPEATEVQTALDVRHLPPLAPAC